MVKKITKYLSSLRFTLLLICLLGLMFLLGLWIPQTSIVSPDLYLKWRQKSPGIVKVLEALGFTSIYSSPTMLILWILFFINLALVMWQRIPLIKKRIALPDPRPQDPATVPGFPFRASYSLPPGTSLEGVAAFLGKNGYAVIGWENGFTAVKNRLSPIAFGLFHISFFLILLGGLISVYTRFVGDLDIAVGEPFDGQVSRYNANPQMPKVGTPPKTAFTVLSITPMMTQGTKTGLKVRLVDDQGVEHEADVNKPYKVDSTNFIVNNLGVAPLFVVRDASGRELDGAIFKLRVLGGKEDTFTLAGFNFRAKFYPDYVVKDGKPASASFEFNNPVFEISAERQGTPLAHGLVPRDGSLRFDGYELVLKELPYWVRLTAIKEHGVWIIYTGFAIASLAVVWRFLFYKRELVARLREEDGQQMLVVAGRSEFYKSLTEDEFEGLFAKMLGQPRGDDTREEM